MGAAVSTFKPETWDAELQDDAGVFDMPRLSSRCYRATHTHSHRATTLWEDGYRLEDLGGFRYAVHTPKGNRYVYDHVDESCTCQAWFFDKNCPHSIACAEEVTRREREAQFLQAIRTSSMDYYGKTFSQAVLLESRLWPANEESGTPAFETMRVRRQEGDVFDFLFARTEGHDGYGYPIHHPGELVTHKNSIQTACEMQARKAKG